MAAERPAFIAAVGPLAIGGLVPAAGGVIVTSKEGKVLGAVGVTAICRITTSDAQSPASKPRASSSGIDGWLVPSTPMCA